MNQHSNLSFFLTGTGTDVGKTYVAQSLINGSDPSEQVSYFKPVQTGVPDSDTLTIKRTFKDQQNLRLHNPLYQYGLAASPDQAALASEQVQPSLCSLIASLDRLDSPINIVEGAGGLHVPLNTEAETWIDFLRATNLPVVLVSKSGLGTINHTALSIESLVKNRIPLSGVVLSGPLHRENVESLRRLYPQVEFYSLPQNEPEQSSSSWNVESKKLFQTVSQWLDDRPCHQYENALSTKNQATMKDRLWFPYTQHRDPQDIPEVISAKGAWLQFADGRKVIDGISSWWTNIIGHGRPEIATAMIRQQQQLDHVIFAGQWHKPAAQLAETILNLARGGGAAAAEKILTRVFYSDNGSTAVEVALKMAFQYHAQRHGPQGGPGRQKFISLRGSYHGDTFGAMSAAASDGFHGVFKPLMFDTLTVTPATNHPSEFCPLGTGNLDERIKELEDLFEKFGKDLAGFVIEPLIMGAAGMLILAPDYVKKIQELCIRYDVLLIADEVFSGFCRTGSWFAYHQLDLKPDIVASAKGLTGGTVTLAVTLATERIFTAFLGPDRTSALMHGHSYTANPIACATASAAIEIMENECFNDKAKALASTYSAWHSAHSFALENFRCVGGILAFECQGSGFGNYFKVQSRKISDIALQHGLFLRPLGNTIYFMPPVAISGADLAWSLDKLKLIIDELKRIES